MLVNNISICLTRISTKMGEISSPPNDGIKFLIGLITFEEISSTNFKRGFGLFGETQLKITEPIIVKKIILTKVLTVSIIAIKPRVISSY